jgi:hypothetical protein
VTGVPRPHNGERKRKVVIQMQKKEAVPLSHAMYKINAKEIKNLNLRAQTKKAKGKSYVTSDSAMISWT